MAYGDLKVRNLIWNTGSGDNTVVLSTLLTGSSPNWTGTATGVNLTLSGDLQVNGTTTTINTTILQVEDKNIEIGKVASPSDTTADGGGWSLLGSTTKTFNWVNSTNAWTSSEHIHLGDNKKFLVGTGSDLQIYHDGNVNTILSMNGALYLKGDASNVVGIQPRNGENAALFYPDGAVSLWYDNSKKIETTSWGVKFWGTTNHLSWIQVSNDDKLRFNDGVKAAFGNSDDLQIYHDGSNSYIDEGGTGKLILESNSEIQLQISGGVETTARFINNGAVKLYYDASKKFETTSTGATVTGTLNLGSGDLYLTGNIDFDDSTAAGNNRIKLGYGDDLQLYHTGTDSRIINTTGDLKIRSQSLKLETTDGQEYIRCTADADVKLFHDNVLKVNTHSTGIQIYGDGSDADGAKIILKHLNNNSTDVISSILFSNNAGEAARIQAETVGANNTGVIKFYTDNAGTSAVACTIGSDGTVSDSKGDLRKIVQNYKTANYTLVSSDAGKSVVQATGGTTITVPNSVFAAGEAITIIGHSGSDITIAQSSGLTLYNTSDGTTGNRTLASRGMATLIFTNGSTAYISGAGLS